MAWLRGNRKTGWRVEDREGGRGSRIIPCSKYMRDHADALAALRAHEEKKAFRQAVNGHTLSSTPIPVALEKWKAHQLKENRISTAYGEELVATLSRIAKARKWTALRDITKTAVKEWRFETTQGTVLALRMIKSFINWLRIEEELPIDAGIQDVGKRELRIKRPKGAVLTEEQARSAWQRAFNIGSLYGGVAIEHLMLFPCRPIDVSRCLISDWNSPAQIITYRNTKNRLDQCHWVPDLHAKRLDAIAAGRKPDEHLFLNPWRIPWQICRGRADGISSWYYHNVGGVLFEGRQRGIYCLKDFAMTRLNKAAGGDRKSVMAIGGHQTASMVDLYAGTNIDAQREILDKVPMGIVSTAVSTEHLRVSIDARP